MNKENTATGESDGGVSHKHYNCIAFIISGSATVTTSDEDYYKLLMKYDGEMLCHPDLFTNLLQQDNRVYLNQSVPYVVRIPKDKLAQLQSVPIDKHAGYATQVYDLIHG